MRLKTAAAPDRGREVASPDSASSSRPSTTCSSPCQQAELAADGFGGEPLIAGQHDRAKAGAAQPRDRVLHAGGRRIGEPDETDEGQSRSADSPGRQPDRTPRRARATRRWPTHR